MLLTSVLFWIFPPLGPSSSSSEGLSGLEITLISSMLLSLVSSFLTSRDLTKFFLQFFTASLLTFVFFFKRFDGVFFFLRRSFRDFIERRENETEDPKDSKAKI